MERLAGGLLDQFSFIFALILRQIYERFCRSGCPEYNTLWFIRRLLLEKNVSRRLAPAAAPNTRVPGSPRLRGREASQPRFLPYP